MMKTVTVQPIVFATKEDRLDRLEAFLKMNAAEQAKKPARKLPGGRNLTL